MFALNISKIFRAIYLKGTQGLIIRRTNCNKETIIPVNEVRRFMVDCIKAAGAPEENACIVGDVLFAADYRGHQSHGINRVARFVSDIKNKVCNATACPKIMEETPATAWVEGCNGLGPVISHFSMELAMKKAKEVGLGFVTCRGSNNFGIAAIYSMKAVNCGLIGLAFSASSPLVCPTRSIESAVGTNPLSMGAPTACEDDNFLLDMATAGTSLGKIELYMHENKPLPQGWALNSKAEMTTSAKEAVEAGRILPLGGKDEITGGFKGYGIATIVEVLCGILSDANYGSKIPRWTMDNKKEMNLGHCFIALDPCCFAPGFEERLQDLLNYLRNMNPCDPCKPVLVAGDLERNNMRDADCRGGILYTAAQIEMAEKLACELKVQPMKELDD